MISFKVNSKPVTFDGDEDTPLLWVLRDHVKLTGTKFGCGIGQCGACTVHVDGLAQRSCVTTAAAIDGKSITTIEGLAADDGELHPVQAAMIEELAPQCGYCTPGQVVSGVALLQRNPNPSRDEVRNALAGNLCRCGAYNNYIDAIVKAAGSA